MKDIHPALKAPKNTVAVHLRTMPKDLHAMLKKRAIDADVSLELFIISTLTSAMEDN